MAKKVYDSQKIQAIAEAIRANTGRNIKYTTETMPSGVYEANTTGFSEGYIYGNQDGYADGYEDGYDHGLQMAPPTLYGSYLLKENPNDIYISDEEYWEIGQNFQGDRVYGYFYDDGWHREAIQRIFGDPIIQILSVNGKTINQYDGYWYYGDDMENYFPDDRFRVIDVCEPVESTNEFYNLFLEMVDVYYEDSPFIRGEQIGYNVGYADGYAEGEANGGGGYDEFWDAYQEYGDRRIYEYAFAGQGWTDKTFNPKYDIVSAQSNNIFSGTRISDLIGCLKRAGVRLDFSNDTATSYLSQASKYLINFPTIDSRKRGHWNYGFYNCDLLHTIEKIILKDDGSQAFSNTSFGYLPSLVEIRFEGVIGKGGLNLQWSKSLSKASIYSIINALSTTTSGLSITLSLQAVDQAFADPENGDLSGEYSTEWANLITTRSNWTINLA